MAEPKEGYVSGFYRIGGGSVNSEGEFTSSEYPEMIHVGLIAGERNTDSEINGYQVTKNECNATVIDGTGSVTVSSAPAHLLGVLIITSGTTLAIVGFLDNLDAAKTVTLTSSSASQFFDFKGARCETSLAVTASVDDDVVVFWKPI